jgi:REP element-mobilizing transposase RayT
MTMPRSALVSLSDTPWYHVVSRCVRRAFLCGDDSVTGKNFNHRRGWIESRLLELAGVFAIDVAAYAVMSNHYHIVVRIDDERAKKWTDEEVLNRWTQLFTGPLFVQRYLSEESSEMDVSQLAGVSTWASTYRERLHDLSWFMRVLNESIARMANAEDDCTGRFWEGRFKSQALLDEHALLTAMAYVDLNPIRAAMAETPEQSDHTSVQQRIRDISGTVAGKTNKVSKKQDGSAAVLHPKLPPIKETQDDRLHSEKKLRKLVQAKLLPFAPSEIFATGIPFAFDDYLELVDTVGRAVHPNKRGFIPDKTPAILIRLEIDVETFIEYANDFLKEFGSAVGTPHMLLDLAASRQSRSLRGMSAARAIFDGIRPRRRCIAAR